MRTGQLTLCAVSVAQVRCVALSENGQCLVTGGFDKLVVLQQIDAGSQLNRFSLPPTPGLAAVGTVRSVHVSPDSTTLVLGSETKGAGAVTMCAIGHTHARTM